jgi:glycosyltransferase involved in cell wall biosynthesis
VRVAVVHEWVAGRYGSERVFERLAGLFPGADLVALSADADHGLDLGGRALRTSVLDRPALRRRLAATLPVMPVVWRTLRADHYDLVLSSHHAFAAHNRLAAGGTHLSYVHSPARYVWSADLDRRGSGPALTPIRAALQAVDLAGIRRVDSFAANSREVAGRIAECWGRAATVIHPPVDIDVFTPAARPKPPRDRGYLLGVSRFIPYKRLELVVETGERAGIPVVLAGRGPLADQLRARAARASVPVTVVEGPTDDELISLYRSATALVFPALEDFGIVPLEAQACGTPVIALAAGGSLDTVQDGVSGVQVVAQDPGLFAAAVEQARQLDPDACRANAERFSPALFDEAVLEWVCRFTPAASTVARAPG